ncbi:MAG: helix-turn-helix domain-containing protein [Patescibacteria group bacterium]|nr:helix-turn-helix domain-containing protein [Patescibacteria group bacterium]
MLKIGQKLREERVKKNLTLEEISKATKIRASFLSAIEKGDYKKLPSPTYAQGFVKNYAEFLGLSSNKASALLRREFDEEKALRILPKGLAGKEDFPVEGIKIRKIPIIIILIFLIVLGYIIFQYRYTFLNPPLEINSPKENAVIDSEIVEISGKTDSNSMVSVNNNPISVSDDGTFKKDIDLFPGKSTIKIKVTNRFGKETIIERHVEIKPGS